MSNQILLLGVGNILYGDEGIGVHAVQFLETQFTFSANVTLMEGGVLGKLLMPELVECDKVIIMDAVLGNDVPGSIYRLVNDDLRKSLSFCDSQHQVDLIDILLSCELMGHRPETVVIGIEPKDWKNMQMTLTPEIQQRFPLFIEAVLSELNDAGGECFPVS